MLKIKFKFASFQESDNLDVVDFTFSNFFSVLFISDQGVVVQARDPSASYHVAEDVANIFHLDDVVHLGYKRIRAENQETDLTLARVYCCTCRLPAGWKVLQRSESHPIVHVDDFLLYVPPPPLPPSES
ncbi:uncharacterized protein LOC109124008 isoform X2 [Vitis vinifera]|uniref:uncharacterized protein LOC109124008 isoform X2 n=1 Tax=Vitis vinifera TaxID=29760 RepID=UPI0008FED2A4|nr:uncharacterized protein LOC109124008 isoform X2 [Vitis vinifera]|eukprot:XP_019081043.1 PREDICTED: uncharacterized protein LOC109124008 [Vitis vinifera]